jgi:hypothetical protein
MANEYKINEKSFPAEKTYLYVLLLFLHKNIEMIVHVLNSYFSYLFSWPIKILKSKHENKKFNFLFYLFF